MDNYNDYLKFNFQYKNEDECRKKLFELRWPNGFICPDCGHTEYYLIKSRNLYQCACCRKQHSVTAGTVLHRSHLPLTKWFWAIYLVCKDKRGISALQLSKELSISHKSAWYLMGRLRKAMASELSSHTLFGIVNLAGEDIGRKDSAQKQPRGIEKQKTIIGLSSDNDGRPFNLKIKLVDNLKARTYMQFASSSISMGSTLQTDILSRSRDNAYTNKLLKNYSVAASNGDAQRWIKVLTLNLKSFIMGTFHGLGKKYLQSYFDEFCFRFNSRHDHMHIYAKLLKLIVITPPFPVAD